MRIIIALLPSFLLVIPLLAPAADCADKGPLPPKDNLQFVGHNGFTTAHLMDVELMGDRAYVSSGWSQRPARICGP